MTEAQKIPLWLDCDPGHDDAYALLLAAHDPRVNLLGVSTVHGNASLDQTTFNARGMLEAIGKRDIKVYSGAAKPITRDAVHAVDIHGESGLDGVTLLPQPIEPAATDVDYLEAMYKALMAAPPNSAWLISTGTLTNIGLVFQKYPDLAEHIKGLSIMGGAIGGKFTDAPMGKVKGEGERFGNWTAYAEFNIYCDPEASHFIFSHPVLQSKTTLVPLDLSHQVLGTKTVHHTLLYGSDRPLDASTASTKRTPSALRALFTQIMSFFAGTYAEVFSITEGRRSTIPSPFLPPSIRVSSMTRAARDFRLTSSPKSTFDRSIKSRTAWANEGDEAVTRRGGCRIPRGVDLAKFWGSIEDCLKRADALSPMPKLTREDLEMHGVFKVLGNLQDLKFSGH